ncbi:MULTISPECIES: hypothetical protein [Xanthomonas]|uniref:hypothetical protein n=1 Tax=Xanthomonas TaxID=338 RepID=UPI001331B8D1|nr:hypothetical protein [Xanthomonas cucurbitae]
MQRSSRWLWAQLATLHRWLGTLLCLCFLVWFSSGLVMLFVPFPSLTDAARRAQSEPLALAGVRVAPAAALLRSGGGSALRLLSVDGVPRYVVTQGERLTSVDAGSGAVLGLLSPAQARAVAEGFGRRPVRTLSGPLQVDQWTVHQRLDPWRPFYRAALDDADGTTLYVSARTGEVMQRTRAAERYWNWLGSIPHWLYFSALRRDFALWDRTVWWLALSALAAALAGTALGIHRSLQARRRPVPDWSPYRNLLRWHHGLGLVAAAIVLAWIFSGWLSMDHGRLFSRGQPSPQALQRYAGGDLGTALAAVAPATLQRLDGSSEICFQLVGGQVWASGYGRAAASTIDLQGADRTPHRLTRAERAAAIARAAARAWAVADTTTLPSDALYRQADAVADDALRLTLKNPIEAQLYLDAVSGQPLLLLDSSRQAYAWLYFAVHTTRLPGTAQRPRLHLAIQLTLLGLGWCLSLSGLLLGIRFLRRRVGQRAPARPARPLPSTATNGGR